MFHIASPTAPVSLVSPPPSDVAASDIGSDSSVHTPASEGSDTREDLRVHARFGDPSGSAEDCKVCGSSHDRDIQDAFNIQPALLSSMNAISSPSLLSMYCSECVHFRRILAGLLLTRLNQVLRSQGVSDPQKFMDFLSFIQGAISGPVVLPIMFQEMLLAKFTIALEIHCPQMGVASICQFMESMDFKLITTHTDHFQIALHCETYLGYPDFGKTLSALHHFRKTSIKGDVFHCFFFMGKSEYTYLPSVFEYPTTLFMNTARKESLDVFYPSLTSARQGLLNFRDPFNPPATFNPTIKLLESYHFKLSPFLSNWADHAQHTCAADASCPARVRTSVDGASIKLSLVWKEDMGSPDRLVLWRLRCVQSCLATMPHPVPDASRYGFYACMPGFYQEDRL